MTIFTHFENGASGHDAGTRFRKGGVFLPASTRRLHCIMAVIIKTVLLLVCSNLFMTFAWYAHLKNMSAKPWFIAALASWGIAFFEYMIQVPANRIGYTQLSLAQLKILQEVITLSVFVPFSILYMKEGFKLDFIWAGLCLVGAVYFMFRT